MVINCENSSNETTGIVVIFHLKLTDLFLKGLESLKDSKLKSINFVFIF